MGCFFASGCRQTGQFLRHIYWISLSSTKMLHRRGFWFPLLPMQASYLSINKYLASNYLTIIRTILYCVCLIGTCTSPARRRRVPTSHASPQRSPSHSFAISPSLALFVFRFLPANFFLFNIPTGKPSNRPMPHILPFSVCSSKFRSPQVLCLPLLRKLPGCGGILPISELRTSSKSGRS